MNIFDIYPYYNVPECPVCGSPVTGRYIRQTSSNCDDIILNGFKHGEIIKVAPGYFKDRNFCLECMAEWEDHIPLTFITGEQKQKEIEKRHITELWDAMEEELKRYEKPRKRMFGII